MCSLWRRTRGRVIELDILEFVGQCGDVIVLVEILLELLAVVRREDDDRRAIEGPEPVEEAPDLAVGRRDLAVVAIDDAIAELEASAARFAKA